MNILNHKTVQTGVLEARKLVWRAQRFVFGDQANPRIPLLPTGCSASITPPTRPEPPDPVLERARKIERQLGIRLACGNNGGEAILVPLNEENPIPRAVARHTTPPDLYEAWWSGTPWLVVLNRAVRVDTSPFELALEGARRGLEGEPLYARLLQVTKGWAVPQTLYGAPPLIARELLLWAPAEAGLSNIGETTALVHGETVPCQEYGETLWAAVCRRARRSGSIRAPHPLLFGAPTQVAFTDGRYEVGGQHHTVWSIVPNLNRLGELQQLDVDLLTLLENIDRALWATCLVRGSAKTPQGLQDLEDTLRAYADNGRLERVRGFHPWGWNLERAYQAFVPGGILPPPQNHFSVPNPKAFLKAITSEVSMVGSLAGDMLLGKVNGRPVFFSRADRPSVCIEGQSGTGKTTTASFLTLTSTPHILLIHLTSVEGEAPARWARDLGGQILNLDLPGAQTVGEEQELIRADAEEIQRFWERLKQRWSQRGEPVGLPIVLRRESGCPIRFAAYALNFVREFKRVWRDLHRETGKQGAIVWDDLAGIPSQKDINLGDMPVSIGMALKEELRLEADTARKMGLQVFYTVHSRKEFLEWPAGFWESLTLAVCLEAGVRHESASVVDPRMALIDPKDEEGQRLGVLIDGLNPKLPRPIVEVLGRTADLGLV